MNGIVRRVGFIGFIRNLLKSSFIYVFQMVCSGFPFQRHDDTHSRGIEIVNIRRGTDPFKDPIPPSCLNMSMLALVYPDRTRHGAISSQYFYSAVLSSSHRVRIQLLHIHVAPSLNLFNMHMAPSLNLFNMHMAPSLNILRTNIASLLLESLREIASHRNSDEKSGLVEKNLKNVCLEAQLKLFNTVPLLNL